MRSANDAWILIVWENSMTLENRSNTCWDSRAGSAWIIHSSNSAAKSINPKKPINLCYDSFGPPAAFIRGLFEYLYKSDRLILIPHIPIGITRLEQRFPIRFGEKTLYLTVQGQGRITSVMINGKPMKNFDETSITLPYKETPKIANYLNLHGQCENC